MAGTRTGRGWCGVVRGPFFSLCFSLFLLLIFAFACPLVFQTLNVDAQWSASHSKFAMPQSRRVYKRQHIQYSSSMHAYTGGSRGHVRTKRQSKKDSTSACKEKVSVSRSIVGLPAFL